MKLLRSYVVFLILLFVSAQVSAQFRYGYFSVGIAVGATNYLGDLDDDFTPKFSRPGVAIVGNYKFHPHMQARLQFFHGWASASDSKNKPGTGRFERNLHFRTPIREASFVLVYDFIATKRKYKYRPKFNPYVFAGVGVFSFNPQAELNGNWIDLQPLGTEGQFLPDPDNLYPDPYNLTQVNFPMGGGLRIMLARNWDLEIEIGWRKLLTDYLDDVSGEYPDLDALRAQNPTAFLLSDRGREFDPVMFPNGVSATTYGWIRGDKTQDDWYIFSNVKVTYILDWVKCPSFR